MKKIGFIGTGMIGNPMARRVLQAGFSLKAYDQNPAALEPVLQAGAEAVRGMEDLHDVEAMLIMVNTMDQVNEVLTGDEGLIPAFRDRPLPLVVVMSTVSPEDIRSLAGKIGASHGGLLDAPVSGGPFLAELGRLAVMVGGPEDDFNRVRPVLEAFGEQVFHVGKLGSGMSMKLVNNVIGLASTLVMPEALKLGVRSGLDVDAMVNILNAGTGKSFFTENWPLIRTFLQTALDEGDPMGARNALFTTGRKDLETARDWAACQGIDTPVLERLLDALDASASGGGSFLENIRTILKLPKASASKENG